jgi:hypothetical protein
MSRNLREGFRRSFSMEKISVNIEPCDLPVRHPDASAVRTGVRFRMDFEPGRGARSGDQTRNVRNHAGLVRGTIEQGQMATVVLLCASKLTRTWCVPWNAQLALSSSSITVIPERIQSPHSTEWTTQLRATGHSSAACYSRSAAPISPRARRASRNSDDTLLTGQSFPPAGSCRSQSGTPR